MSLNVILYVVVAVLLVVYIVRRRSRLSADREE
jgi:hypothetical protein